MKNKILSIIAATAVITTLFALPVSYAESAADIVENNIYRSDLGFSMIFPPEWENYRVKSITLDWGELGTVSGVEIEREENPAAITISRYTTEQWNSLMMRDDEIPSMLGAGSGFVLGYSTSEESFDNNVQWILDHTNVHSKNLTDIADHPNETAIQYLLDHLIISGYPDESFKPEQTINRAELMKIITEASGAIANEEDYNNCFPDVTNQWFAVYVCYAKDQNWVQGYPDGNFKPENDINKVEALKMIINSQGMSIPGAVNETVFNDVDNSAWYAPFVKTAKDKGLLEQTDDTYGVDELITRGEVSENIYRALLLHTMSSIGEEESTPTEEKEPTDPDEVIASIKDYAVFDSESFHFSVEYPDQWFYEGLPTDPETGARSYNFGPDINEDGDPLTTLELGSGETPDGTVITMNDKDLVLVEDGDTTSVYYTGDATGRRFRVHGALEYEDVMLNMLHRSLIEKKRNKRAINLVKKPFFL